jgi:hypothetical protein
MMLLRRWNGDLQWEMERSIRQQPGHPGGGTQNVVYVAVTVALPE